MLTSFWPLSNRVSHKGVSDLSWGISHASGLLSYYRPIGIRNISIHPDFQKQSRRKLINAIPIALNNLHGIILTNAFSSSPKPLNYLLTISSTKFI